MAAGHLPFEDCEKNETLSERQRVRFISQARIGRSANSPGLDFFVSFFGNEKKKNKIAGRRPQRQQTERSQ